MGGIKCKVAAGIVTFNPDYEKLKACIQSVLFQVSVIYIVDNHSNGYENLEKTVELFDRKKIFIKRNKENMGIACALNSLLRWAEKDGYTVILTLDQDSICEESMVEQFGLLMDNNVGIVCPQYKDSNEPWSIEKKDEIKQIISCITSGSLTRVSAWRDIGGFDERLFIDGVDHDFCYRLRKKGYIILQNNNFILYHEIGNTRTRRFLWKKICVRNHSAFREYYIVRNMIYLDKKMGVKGYPFIVFKSIAKRIFVMLLYEKEKKEKLLNTIKGIKDGIKMDISPYNFCDL